MAEGGQALQPLNLSGPQLYSLWPTNVFKHLFILILLYCLISSTMRLIAKYASILCTVKGEMLINSDMPMIVR